jgi:tRNA modification GTPase
VIAVSATTGEGLDDLKTWIFAKTVKGDSAELGRERIAVNARQAAALRDADEALARLETLIDEGAPAELLSVEARAAADGLGAVTGRAISDQLLETIFSRFCIGK